MNTKIKQEMQSRPLSVKCRVNRELSFGRRKQGGFRGFWVASRCYIKRLILCPPMWLKEKLQRRKNYV